MTMNNDAVRDCVGAIVGAIEADEEESVQGKQLARLVGIAIIHASDAIVLIANSLETIATAQNSLADNDKERFQGR